MPYVLFGGFLMFVCIAIFLHWKQMKATVTKERDDAAKAERDKFIDYIRSYELTDDEFNRINKARNNKGLPPLSMETAKKVSDWRKNLPYDVLVASTLSMTPGRVEGMYEFLVNYAEQVDESEDVPFTIVNILSHEQKDAK